MADEIQTIEPIEPIDHAPEQAPIDEPAELTAAARLRAFEDEHFGPDAVRINGEIERGSGSPFQEMEDSERRRYEALEKLIVAEQKLGDANAALAVAQSEYAEALAAVEDKPDADAA